MAHIRLLVHVALLLALALVLLRPQRLLAVEAAGDALLITPRLHLAMAGVGFWTGLIVLDAASYLLVSLVLIGRVALQQANAMKAVLIGLATLVSVMVFVQGGEVGGAPRFRLFSGVLWVDGRAQRSLWARRQSSGSIGCWSLPWPMRWRGWCGD